MSSVLDLSSFMMQWIESKGYLVSFLIQDGLGMTAPRVWTGFHRDKEITGEYNVQEGLEVLGREGITGPYIIGVAPAILALTLSLIHISIYCGQFILVFKITCFQKIFS